MAHSRALLVSIFVICFVANSICKIVLPHKLRYLENMLNSEVVAKAAKIRQRMEANPNLPEADKNWPMLLAKYNQDEKKNAQPVAPYYNMYSRRMPNLK